MRFGTGTRRLVATSGNQTCLLHQLILGQTLGSEDDGAEFRQDEIGFAGQQPVVGCVDREAVAEAVEHRAQGQFRPGVAPADAGHDLGAFLRCEDVGHGERMDARLEDSRRKPRTRGGYGVGSNLPGDPRYLWFDTNLHELIRLAPIGEFVGIREIREIRVKLFRRLERFARRGGDC